MTTGALSHLKVLDLSRVLAGPWATQILADLGATVWKIENPEGGDDTRGWGPPWREASDGEKTAAYYLSANRNKNSVALDLSTPEGAEAVRALALQADVVVENFKTGGLAKYGLDYETLSRLKPDLVYCSITGFGHTGPRAKQPGYDFMIQGLCGLMSVTGRPDDQPGGGPMKVGVATVDLMTGLYSVIGILAALAHRDRTGEGQHVDMALFDVGLASLAYLPQNYLLSGQAPKRLGNAHPSIVPYEAIKTADGWMILAVGNDSQFAHFCAVAGRPELANDPRFHTNAARVENRVVLEAMLKQIVAAHPLAWWLEELTKAGVPAGPINDIAGAFADPQAAARGLRVEVSGQDGGTIPLLASPLRLSKTPPSYRKAPPELGEDTARILGQSAKAAE